ncbi:hypothetical protein C480_18737 [Natrialba aegyptia DSM 13077]|uniref:Uncharacterized protein n=1 Tax=Natrialba aegyptia DSM 13077 TaxID=1227491 RepID=M0ATG7_9EURY|nr:hypothetical protein C480_18737 [Natrialba aegyptia DSM 13077]
MNIFCHFFNIDHTIRIRNDIKSFRILVDSRESCVLNRTLHSESIVSKIANVLKINRACKKYVIHS